VRKSRDPTDKWVIDPDAFWRHSLGCALVTQRIAQNIGYPEPEKAYLAGLLHDIGFLVNSVLYNKDFECLRLASEQRAPLHVIEEQVLGFTHNDTGQMLCEQWGLPKELVAATRCHHDLGLLPTAGPLACLVHLSDLLCRVRYLSYGYERSLRVDLGSDEAWQTLVRTYPKLQNMDLARFHTRLRRSNGPDYKYGRFGFRRSGKGRPGCDLKAGECFWVQRKCSEKVEAIKKRPELSSPGRIWQPSPRTAKLLAQQPRGRSKPQSDYFGLTTWTVRRLVSTGKLAAKQIGKRFTIKRNLSGPIVGSREGCRAEGGSGMIQRNGSPDGNRTRNLALKGPMQYAGKPLKTKEIINYLHCRLDKLHCA